MAKKSLGQNYLSDPKILERIADLAHITKQDIVLEVGPGMGSLTKFLLERAKEVIAVEKDGELASKLKEAKIERLKIIEGDILEIENLLKIAKLEIENYVLVGNIPYYITGALFKKFLESKNPPSSITFVVQKEVAERIAAKDGKESILSISVKAYGEPQLGGIIKAGSFSPVPKVDSGIISVRGISKERFKKTKISEKEFFEVIKKGFAHKRKLLRRNLGIDGEILEKCNIDINSRAEDLSVDDWFCIIHNS
jgi:16S rRNA (adenine1518-N6/adenine1519-N6)-dimethyltransferase